MSHYFISPTGSMKRHQINATIWGRDYRFTTANGVFSMGRLDLGTSVLLRTVDPPLGTKEILDLGCGFGPIAVALARENPHSHITAVDVNEVAVQLTAENAEIAGVSGRLTACQPAEVPAMLMFDEIWSNPPIRIGKDGLHEMLGQWLPRLTDDGLAWLVVGKNLGSDSLQRWLAEQGWTVERVASAKGFRVLKVCR